MMLITQQRKLLYTDDLMEQIKKGNFSSIKESKKFERVYLNEMKNENIEFIEIDLNGNGLNELIWQDKESYGGDKRIVGIFAFHDNETKCILWDTIYLTEYYFLSNNGNIIYYYQDYGTLYINVYTYYKFDTEYNKEMVYELYLYGIYDFSEINMKWWQEINMNDIVTTTHGDKSYYIIIYFPPTIINTHKPSIAFHAS